MAPAPTLDSAAVAKHPSGNAKATAALHTAPAPITFHSGAFCPFANTTFIALEEKRLPYQYKEVDPYKKEPAFLALNPKGLVPTIEHQGKAIYESLVILEFLDEAFPDYPRLLPSDAFHRATARLAIDEGRKKVLPLFYKLMQAQLPAGSRELAELRAEFAQSLAAWAKNWLGEGGEGKEFHGGAKIDAVDVSLAPWACRLYILEKHRGGPFTAEVVSPRFLEWKEAILRYPAVQRIQSDPEVLEATYDRYLRNESQSEVAKATRDGKVLP